MAGTPFKSLELKSHKTDVKGNLAARPLQPSSSDPIRIQKAFISVFISAPICWVWVSFVSVSDKSKHCCLYWRQPL